MAKPRVAVDDDTEAAASQAIETAPTQPAKRVQSKDARLKSIHIDSTTVEAYAAPPTKRYWIGAIPSAPFDNKHAAGITICKYTGLIEADPASGVLNLDRAYAGAIVEMSDKHVEDFKNAVAHKAIRTVGRREDATGNYRCDSYNVTDERYRATSVDKPLGCYVYMVEMDERMPMDWRKTVPPVMDQSYS